VELAVHGSPVLLDVILRRLLAGGVRLARPGEFTERAFLHGRLDLLQAEAVRDLIEAQTTWGARVAAEQLDGGLSRRVRPVKERLVGSIARMEAGIDFAEDDTPVVDAEELRGVAAEIAEELRALEASWTQGRLVHGGVRLALVGEPNVGKSSLFNALVERERAIVTAEAGTTRDLVVERVTVGGLAVELVDTAGLRVAGGEAERMGMERSREALAEADLVLVVVDARQPGLGELGAGGAVWGDGRGLREAVGERPALLVLNKSDLLEGSALGRAQEQLRQAWGGGDEVVVATCAVTSAGVAALREAIVTRVGAGGMAEGGAMLTSLRQWEAVRAAREAVERARDGAGLVPDEMVMVDLYAALEQLDELTGATGVEAILQRVFAEFCIGK
jgi:tRNA modification GTPase